MPVNLPELIPASLTQIQGIRLGWAEANIKKQNRKDLLVIEIAEGSTVSGGCLLKIVFALPPCYFV